MKRTPLPTQVGYDNKLQSGRDTDEDDEHADELHFMNINIYM